MVTKTKCDCASMNGRMCHFCLEKDYYAISADNFRLIQENQRLREELIQANNQIKLLIAIETSGKDS